VILLLLFPGFGVRCLALEYQINRGQLLAIGCLVVAFGLLMTDEVCYLGGEEFFSKQGAFLLETQLALYLRLGGNQFIGNAAFR
jgi:hypothetical protein